MSGPLNLTAILTLSSLDGAPARMDAVWALIRFFRATRLNKVFIQGRREQDPEQDPDDD